MRSVIGSAQRRLERVCVLSLALATFSCGSCDEQRGSTSNNNSGDTGGVIDDGGAVANNAAADGGANNASTDAGHTDGGGEGEVCGSYGTICDGVCISTAGDPDNCGGCGVICSDAEVCLGGQCGEGCLPGLTACERTCVDVANDSAHCGACSNACGDGMGCVEGMCVDAIDVDFDAASCEGAGPPIDLGEAVRDDQQCAANLAELTFRFGACSCQDFVSNNPLTVDAYDSQLGPYVPGGLGGGVGVNGSFINNNGADISGTLWVGDDLQLNQAVDVGMSLLAGGNVNGGSGSIGRDAFVGGTINGQWTVANTLHLPTGASAPNGVTYGQLVNQNISVAPPCTECPPNAIDVGAIVTTFGGDNDNALIGLDPDALNPSTAPMRLDLPCGRYYLSGINSNAAVTIVAHGHTALFIEGDVIANNPLTITVTPEAQLDIFVAGNLTTNNEFKLGSPNYPALLRVYIGGDVGFTTNNPVTLAGYLYAVPGSVTANNEVEVYGGLYSNGITTNNAWNIHYDRRITTIGDSCRGSGGGSGGSNNGTNNGSNNGTNNGSNGGSNNGSSTDICTTQGDACSTSSECCSPLSCEGGVCSLLDCVPSNGACSSNSDCCRGLCSSTTDGICIIQ